MTALQSLTDLDDNLLDIAQLLIVHIYSCKWGCHNPNEQRPQDPPWRLCPQGRRLFDQLKVARP